MTQQLTKQEAFDKAAKGVIAQGKASTVNGKQCVYVFSQGRGRKKLHCGVGHLLKNDEMRRRWDDDEAQIAQLTEKGWAEMEADREKSGIADIPRSFLEGIQDAHDRAHDRGCQVVDFITGFKENMRDLAARHDLDPAVLDA